MLPPGIPARPPRALPPTSPHSHHAALTQKMIQRKTRFAQVVKAKKRMLALSSSFYFICSCFVLFYVLPQFQWLLLTAAIAVFSAAPGHHNIVRAVLASVPV